MRIHLTKNWETTFENYLQKQIEEVDPCQGWWWDDCRFDYEYGSIRGVAGEVIQDYDSARHAEIEPVWIPLKDLPVGNPYDEEEEPIRTETELMEFIKMVIIDEFPHVDCGEWPDLRLVAGFRTIAEYGAKIHSAPSRFLEVNFEFEPIRR